MRLLKAIPELEAKIESGELLLCVAAQAQSFFRQIAQSCQKEGKAPIGLEEKKAIVDSLLGATSRECERKLAALFPEKPPLEKERAVSEDATVIQFTASRELSVPKPFRALGLL